MTQQRHRRGRPLALQRQRGRAGALIHADQRRYLPRSVRARAAKQHRSQQQFRHVALPCGHRAGPAARPLRPEGSVMAAARNAKRGAVIILSLFRCTPNSHGKDPARQMAVGGALLQTRMAGDRQILTRRARAWPRRRSARAASWSTASRPNRARSRARRPHPGAQGRPAIEVLVRAVSGARAGGAAALRKRRKARRRANAPPSSGGWRRAGAGPGRRPADQARPPPDRPHARQVGGRPDQSARPTISGSSAMSGSPLLPSYGRRLST